MTQSPASLEQLLDLFRRAGMAPTAEDVAEILWLAARLPAASGEASPPPAQQPAPTPALPREAARPSLPPGRGETFGPAATATGAAAAAGPSAAQLYPIQAAAAGGGAVARTIRSPAAFALPGSLEIGRNLRPLKRRVPSRSHVVLDEPATAHHIADTGDWTPVFNPAPERWLDVLLLVEESSSMIIWQRTLSELGYLLERQGAFRNVEVLGFRANPGDTSIRLYTGVGPTANRSRVRRQAELIDPTGRRLIAVVSDCVSPAWHNGVMATSLAFWGHFGMVTLVQVLPDTLWVRTGLRTYPAIYLRSPAPGAANSQFEVKWTTYRPKPPPKGMAVPVVTLEALSLGYWARAMAGNSNLWIPGVFATPAVPVQTSSATQPAAARAATAATPDQLLHIFHGAASPTARRLASYLAAVPLTLPVMRLVQRALLPDSRQVHLAEVWLSGLIDRPAEVDDKMPADSIEYFFVAGVREQLLSNLRLGEAIDVLSTVSSYVGERIGQPMDFGALIADPTATGEMQIAEGYQPFARVAASALRRFGGQYADLAQRLEVSVYGAGVSPAAPVPEIKVERGTERKTKPAKSHEGAVTIRALLVGTNEHAASDKITPLQGAVDDVLLTRAWLEEQCGVSPGNIQELLDSAATKQAIVDAWRQLASQTEDGDQFYFHFSGNDQEIASSDPNEADGMEETLVVYDSIPGERATLLTHQELADLAAEVEQRGGQVVMLLDSCRTASGVLSRRALSETLVFAGAAEAQEAFEKKLSGKTHGGVTYFLAEAMKAYRPEMTWLDAYDYVLANIRAMGFRQTPQLIGAGDQTIFGSERHPVPPCLLVTKAAENEIEVFAPVALGMKAGETGARLAIYPPGSAMADTPIGFARVRRLTETGATALLESPVSVPVASRVRVLDYGDARPVIRVGMDADLLERIEGSPLISFERPGAENLDFTVSIADDVYAMQDRDGRIVWRDPVAPTANLETDVGRIRAVLEHVAAYLRAFALENPTAAAGLAGKVDLEVIATASTDSVTLGEAEPLALRLRNRSDTDLYVSVWMFDEALRIQRIFPATTSCVLLGKGRDIQLAVAVLPNGAADRPARMTFKVFASAQPADLGLLSLPPVDQPVELGDLTAWTNSVSTVEPGPIPTTERAPKARAKAAPKDDLWIPGGPVAVTAKLWKPGTTLRIKFLKGDPEVHKKVMEAALEWTQYANLRFEIVHEGDAELRVGFDQGGSWSYVGQDSLTVAQDKPTINLGWLTPTSADEEVRRVVIHEFGHALGLAASQQSPIANIPWNKKATYAYYAKQGWDRRTVDTNVFMKYNPSQVKYGPPDPYSIMYHPIPNELTDGKVEIYQGSELSDGDKQFIAQLYPRGEAA